MRTLKKSLLVLAGLFTPALASVPAEAGVIPWVYDSIFRLRLGTRLWWDALWGLRRVRLRWLPSQLCSSGLHDQLRAGVRVFAGRQLLLRSVLDRLLDGDGCQRLLHDRSAVSQAGSAGADSVDTKVTPRVPVDEFGRPTRPGPGAPVREPSEPNEPTRR